MKYTTMILPAGLLLLGACAAQVVEPTAPTLSPAQQMLESAISLAAPNQDPQTARLRADDNCYWYSHVGPVETTELPLLTSSGSHICGPAEVAPITPAEPST